MKLKLKTYDGAHFVCAENGGRELVANRTEAHQWETFKIIGPNGKIDGSAVRNGDKISFQTYDGTHFVCAENGGGQELIANRTEAHQWETFTVQFVSASAVPMPTMRIIHISDPHFTDSSRTLDAGYIIDSQNSKLRSNVLSNYLINNKSHLRASKVVITGDLTDSGDKRDYLIAKAFVDKLKNNGFEVYSIPGNHDYCIESNLCAEATRLARKDSADNRGRRDRFIKFITGYAEYPPILLISTVGD